MKVIHFIGILGAITLGILIVLVVKLLAGSTASSPTISTTHTSTQEVHPPTDGTPNIEILDETNVAVHDEIDAQTAFEKYVADNNKDWEFIKAELITAENDKDYYQVTYRHHELSGGTRRVLIDMDGTVNQPYLII